MVSAHREFFAFNFSCISATITYEPRSQNGESKAKGVSQLESNFIANNKYYMTIKVFCIKQINQNKQLRDNSAVCDY